MDMSRTTAELSDSVDPIGATEAAVIVGVHRANFVRDWADRPGFPAPIGHLSRGRVWDRAAVTRYSRVHGPVRGVALRSLPLTADAAHWIPTIKRRIIRGFRPLRLVVFGSQAAGGARQDSDLDLLVVMPDGTDERATAVAILRALRDLPLSKDVVVTTPSQVNLFADVPGTILRDALGTGSTIYARP
jgi:predicted nucleotidyltransferase